MRLQLPGKWGREKEIIWGEKQYCSDPVNAVNLQENCKGIAKILTNALWSKIMFSPNQVCSYFVAYAIGNFIAYDIGHFV